MYSQVAGRQELIPISKLSMICMCETKYYDAMTGKAPVTLAMRRGSDMHRELALRAPKMTVAEIMNGMATHLQFSAREISVIDTRLRLKGRIDQLNLTGKTIGDKSECIVIEDKYPRQPYDSIPQLYKLQLAAYALAMMDSKEYGRLCTVTGVQLICRGADHSALREFSAESAELSTWEYNVPLAVKVAWALYDGKRPAEHRRLDITTGAWGPCSCYRK